MFLPGNVYILEASALDEQKSLLFPFPDPRFWKEAQISEVHSQL